ncbi:Non-specific lipid-transfer protein [Spatholobus suberectus]|nr:Non-specific lipid-transfer protein [Spatholobus suberectus]
MASGGLSLRRAWRIVIAPMVSLNWQPKTNISSIEIHLRGCFGYSLADAALSSPQVQLIVAPCIAYARGPGGPVPAPCCNGVRTLNNQARTTPDRQGFVGVSNPLLLSFPGLNFASIAALPAKCGVNLPFKLSLSTDCNKVK